MIVNLGNLLVNQTSSYLSIWIYGILWKILPGTWSLWGDDQPDNAGGDQSCAALDMGQNLRLNDVPCLEESLHVCHFGEWNVHSGIIDSENKWSSSIVNNHNEGGEVILSLEVSVMIAR